MSDQLQQSFRALADPTRRQILMSLRGQDLTIGEVSSQFDITRAAVRKHLNFLEEGRLISVYPRGRERVTHLEPSGIKSAEDWFHYFDKFWDEGLSNLKSVIE